MAQSAVLVIIEGCVQAAFGARLVRVGVDPDGDMTGDLDGRPGASVDSAQVHGAGHVALSVAGLLHTEAVSPAAVVGGGLVMPRLHLAVRTCLGELAVMVARQAALL